MTIESSGRHDHKDVVQLEQRIRPVRGVQVILDADLAEVYGESTRVLNQAVRRNRARFPVDFAFLLSSKEWGSLRSQIVISKPGRGGRRHSAWAFTEHGAIMAASILSTSQAVETSVFLAALERKVVGHDVVLKTVFAALWAILEPPKKAGRAIR